MHNKPVINDTKTDFGKEINRLSKELNKYKVTIILSLIFSTVSSILAIISPKKLEELTNTITKGLTGTIDLEKITHIMTVLIIIYVVSAVFDFFEKYLMVDACLKFAKELRSKISNKINKLPLRFFDNHASGDILSVVTNDVDTVSSNLNNSLGLLVGSITLLIGCLFMMFKTNWIMALTAIFSSLIGLVFLAIILRKSQKYFTKRQEELGKLNGHIEEIYSSQTLVKAYNGEKDALDKFNKLNDKVYTCNFKSQFLGGLMPSIMGFIGNFGYVLVCIVGALLTMNNKIEFGVIVAFFMYVRLFSNPLSQIAQSLNGLQSVAAASKRVFNFLEEKEMTNESDKTKKLDPKVVKGNITFEHVKFGYDKNKTIIKDFNATVKPGEKIAIVGPTGAGKTTIVNLLMKFYEIIDGKITIDGVNINDLKRENIHDLFIMILQDTWLFNGTIRDNIKYNNRGITDEEIWNALKIVGTDHFVKSLPNGLDYEITESESISAGQRQLLTIARGMIKNAPFLILDEATSNVDTRTEELVQKAMDKLTKGRTSFIIAHRLSTIKNADLILVMKDGNIIEQGTHQQLLKQNGFYAELYNSQFRETK